MTQTLVFHHGALGDWVVTFPLLRALGPRVTVVAQGEKATLAARLLANVPALDAESMRAHLLFSERDAHRDGDGSDGGKCLDARDIDIARPLRDALASAARIVSYISTGSGAWAANVVSLAPQALTYFVDPRPPADWRDHVTAWHRHQLTRQGCALAESDDEAAAESHIATQQRVPCIDDTHAETIPSRDVIIHPGSGGRSKCWPIDRFITLANRITQDRERHVRFIVGEVEMDQPAVAATIRAAGHSCDVVTSLAALDCILRSAAAFIGNDSGPSHLAAFLGTPTLALFGLTDHRHWAPVGQRTAIIAPPKPQPMTWITVDDAYDALGDLMKT